MKFVQLLFGIYLFVACTEKQHPPVSFYHWKQTFSLANKEQSLLKHLKTQILYVKYFDVVSDPELHLPKPISIVEFKSVPKQHIIPCIYIQNNVFTNSCNNSNLANKVSKLIHQISKRNNIQLSEIQIDCDWTKTTKSTYFHFLNELIKLNKSLKISCTIRLHQLKYPEETGVPPVVKGVLMCYNMDDIDQFNTSNSIINSKVFNQYVSENTKYDLPLDLALPMFQWGLVYRLSQLTLIVNNLSQNDVSSSNFKMIKKNVYQVVNNHYVKGSYLCRGDLIRLEKTTKREILEISNMLKSSNMSFNQLILYHLSSDNQNQFNETFIQQINRLIP
jgi:hypothetical protein